jgi:hypothetical protein
VFFWLRFLPQHNWPGTALHISLVTLTIGSAALFQRMTRDTLRGTERRPFYWKTAYKDMRVYGRAAVAIAAGVIFSILSFGAIEGVRHISAHFMDMGTLPDRPGRYGWPREKLQDLKANAVQRWVPQAFKIIGYNVFADISDADVSIKLANWTGLEEKRDEDVALVRGARLSYRDLRFIQAAGAFFQRANLAHSDLQQADLFTADFRRASLSHANMRRANLSMANFKEASLMYANLEEADLRGADFSKAVLLHVNLRNADLREVDLSQARLLTQEQIDQACVDESTKLPSGLRKPPPCPDIKGNN